MPNKPRKGKKPKSKLEKLEYVLSTLIVWLQTPTSGLREDEIRELLKMLK